MNKFDLEERLIDFAVLIVEIDETLQKTRAGAYFGGQLLRSGSSPALNYGEAQSGESRRDFIHKIKIILKELRETMICLKIIKRSKLIQQLSLIDTALKENNELISIFVKSAETAQKNLDAASKKRN
ncbi:MAG: four helix bundle protein [Bacteroidales bacterium]|jgi:four helix bundle protein|nr:four helix bundle protein [Bacteroidales bacterium]